MKNKNNMRCKARKDYVCDNCGAKIPANTAYRRVNIRGLGIYHFVMKNVKKRLKMK